MANNKENFVEYKYCANDDCEHDGRLLRRSMFSKNAKGADGLQTWCKDCHRKYAARKNKAKATEKASNPDNVNLRDTSINEIEKHIRAQAKALTEKDKEIKELKDKVMTYEEHYVTECNNCPDRNMSQALLSVRDRLLEVADKHNGSCKPIQYQVERNGVVAIEKQ